MLTVISFVYEDTDELFANTYLLKDELNQCVIIDPGKDYPGLVNYINKNSLKLKAVLLTHGHVDHMRGVDALIASFHAPLYIGFDDEDKLKDTYANCSLFLGENVVVKSQPLILTDGDVLHFLSEDIIAIHTPYHTAGSMCFYLKESGILFSGDFLFARGVGRSDLPSAMPQKWSSSIEKLERLNGETKLYPGHGKASKLGEEIAWVKQNIF